MTADEAEKFVDLHVAQLGEHFEAVQIFVSVQTPNGTMCLKRGGGNWYARQGMAHEFIGLTRAQEQAHSIAQELRPED